MVNSARQRAEVPLLELWVEERAGLGRVGAVERCGRRRDEAPELGVEVLRLQASDGGVGGDRIGDKVVERLRVAPLHHRLELAILSVHVLTDRSDLRLRLQTRRQGRHTLMLPLGRRNNLAAAKPLNQRRDLADVGRKVVPLFVCRAEDGSGRDGHD